MTTTPSSFDLLDEPWVQVLTLDGELREVSLLDLFRQASKLREVVGDLPTQSFAILRFALTVLHRATKGPRDSQTWERLWAAEELPMPEVEAYLGRYRERFDLLHPTTPFFQVAGLRTAKGEFSGLEKLVADVPAGYPYFTTRTGRGLELLTFAEAARWLVHLQAFDISGIKSGAVGDDRVKGGRGYPIGTGWAGAIGGLLVEGETLRQTLLLNLVPRDVPTLLQHSAADRAAWEVENLPTAAEALDLASRPYGPLDLYTWQSRRVLLRHDDEGVTGVLVCNGDRITPQNRHPVEPMTAWRHSPTQEKALKESLVYMPRRHIPSRALWRGLGQLLPFAAERGKADEGRDAVTAGVLAWVGRALAPSEHVRVRAVGMEYGTMNAAVNDVVDDSLGLSVALLQERDPRLPRAAIDAVAATEEGVRALRNLASNLVRAGGGTDSSLVDGARTRAAETAYAALDAPFRRWIIDLSPGEDPQEARIGWHRQARRVLGGIADRLVREAGPAAWVGREVNGRRITSPEADGWFRIALAAALPVLSSDAPTPTDTDTPPQEDVA